jgi:precorrin-2/cobalt-factor-2 C20-methyltransferase
MTDQVSAVSAVSAVSGVDRSRGAVTARLIGVGVGPGDPDLLTLKAVRAIREADVILAPTRRPGGRSMALEIVREHVDELRQRVVVLPFPDGPHPQPWDDVARQIVAELGASRRGVFLTEGDPLLFGSFGDVVAALRTVQPDLAVEIIPGVSSVTAAAAAAGVPLTDSGERLAIVPATRNLAHVESALRAFECVVILKIGRVLGDLLRLLDRTGRLDDAVYVRRCGWPEQQVVHDVRSLIESPPTDYFALLIVRRASRDTRPGGGDKRR